jgi:MFS family permease
MENPEPKGRVFYGWSIVILLMYTLVHTAGNGFYGFMVYVPRLLEDLKCSAAQLQGAAVLWAVVFGLSSPLIGMWMHKYGARKVFITGTMCGGLVLLFLSMITDYRQLYVLNLAAGVVAAATILLPSQTVVTLWFDKYRGRAMALVLMGVGIGGAFVPWLITKFLILFTNWIGSVGGFAEAPLALRLLTGMGGQLSAWRGAVRVGVILNYLIVVPPLALWLRNRPADVGQYVDGIEPTGDSAGAAQTLLGISVKRALTTPTFWLVFGVYLLQLVAMSGIQNNTQLFVERQGGYPMETAFRFYALATLVTIPMRFVFGWLSDRFDPKNLMAWSGFFLLGGTLTLWVLVLRLGMRGNLPVAVFGLFQGFGVAANAVTLPILVGRCFGARDFGKIIGYVMMGFAIGVIFGPAVMAAIFDATKSFELAFVYSTVLLIGSVVLALLIRTTALHPEFNTGEEPATAPSEV